MTDKPTPSEVMPIGGGAPIGGSSSGSVGLDQPFTIVSNPSYAEQAEALRLKLRAALKPVCQILDEAHRAEFTLNFNCPLNPQTGKFTVSEIIVSRHY